MAYFPIFMDLSDKTVMVAGGGAVAERRIRSILPFAGRVVVIADAFSESLESLLEEEKEKDGLRVAFFRRAFDLKDFETEEGKAAFMVLACTDDAELNRRIVAACRARGILGNNASDRGDCDFFFPGLIHREPFVVGFTAGGQAHRLVKELRVRTEEIVEDVSRKRKAEEGDSLWQTAEKRL